MATSRTAPRAGAPTRIPPPLQPLRGTVLAVGMLVLATTVVTALAAWADPPADEWVYQQVRDLELPAALEGGWPWWTVALVAPLGLLARRCRALLVGYAVGLPLALGTGWLLGLLVARPRPFDTSSTGDGFPSLVVLGLAFVAVLGPVAVRVGTGSRLAAVLTAVVLGASTAAAALGEVTAAEAWPYDVGGAALLGGLAASGVLLVTGTPSRLHARCQDCPWQHAVPTARSPLHHHGGPAHPFYRAALAWTVLVVAGLGYLAATRGIPRTPESGVMGTGIELPLNLGLLALMLVGVLVAARWHLTGTVVVGLAAVLLGYAASVRYSPSVSLLVLAAGAVPAVLLWLQWHRAATVRAALGTASVMSLVVATVLYFAATNYTAYWGPTHPTSATAAAPADVVDWMVAGDVTASRVRVNARTEEDAEVRLAVSEHRDLSDPTFSAPARSTADSQHVVSLVVRGLRPDRAHHYALELDGRLYRERTGHVRTFPRGPASFTFAVASCARTGSNGKVYDAIRATDPLFFLDDGDWFYGDVDVDDEALFRRQYDANLTSPAQAALYASTAFAYVWDDHDYGGNDADGSSPSRDASMAVYRQYIPHYPLRGPDSPLFQAFTVGDVRFVLTDPRAARDAAASPPTMLGAEQRAWLVDELARAGEHGLVVWVNGAPWVGKADPTKDTWAGFAEERGWIADRIAELGVDNLLMVSGDAHMLAYDDGSHTDYSRSGEAGFPLLHAASLDRKGSVKGGPYTGPVLPGGGQFATVRVTDDGTTVRVELTGRTWDGEVLFRRSFERVRD